MDFESLMFEGVKAQSVGDHLGALGNRQAALMTARDNIQRARAFRDISASNYHLGHFREALVCATDSLQEFDLLEHVSEAEVRELAASQMWAGTLAVCRAISDERVGLKHDEQAQTGLNLLRASWGNIKYVAESHEGKVDQYAINTAGRLATAEALYGEHPRALHMGIKAVGLAFLSESRATSTYDPNMSVKQKLRARLNGVVRGVAAIGVDTLNHALAMRGKALKLANRIL